MTEPFTALSLTGPLALGLAVGDRDALGELDDAHTRGEVDVIVLGADTAAGAREHTAAGAGAVVRALDPVTVAVAWHGRFPRWRFLAVAAPTRDHPYNLARRILGAHHLSDGRIGLALADDDLGLPLDRGSIPWLAQTPPGPEVTADAARAIRKLWNGWPAGTIVGDRESGLYARVDEVRPIDHDGIYRIAGPLGTPASALGDPVLAHWGTGPLPDWADFSLNDRALRAGLGIEARP